VQLTPDALLPEPLTPQIESDGPVLSARLPKTARFAQASGVKILANFTPNTCLLPHPPYPPEARELQQTGVVQMLVHFDEMGNVSRVEVAKSSGVASLDAATRSFIRDNWHSLAFAGQEVSVPVEFRQEDL
jgi:TonB family protein